MRRPSARRRPSRTGEAAPVADVAGLSARRRAAAAVAEVLRGGLPLDDALLRAPPSDDGPFARAIAVATFRRFGTIWRALEARLPRGMPDNPDLVAILATGTAQLLVLDTPAHAAVDLAVRLAGADPRVAYGAGLVNAVLRRIARERDAILATETDPLRDPPEWLAERWVAAFGMDRARAVAAAHRAGATVDVTVKADPKGWGARLGGTLLPTGSVRLPEGVAIPDLPGFAEGAWWVQDAAAALPVRLLAPAAGERVADLCAAPGGKTAQIAAAGARTVAVDRSAKRLERLAGNLARLGLEAEIVAADALAWEAEPFDAVLLDAPCTATGTLRRHPDVAWTKRARDLAALVDLQRRLLDRAATLVRPGGRLVYCVCSLERAEGEEQAAAFLERHAGFRRVPVDVAALGLGPECANPDGDLRTTPDGFVVPGTRPGWDGFFAARFVRAGPSAEDTNP